ncbi:MAG: hypothetical protein FJZ89_14640 [Chloroflexi bacterium]|nr:hypothetical protein [Chloroflexota bacterium]
MPVGTDPTTMFWLRVRELKYTDEKGKQILAQCGNNPASALQYLNSLSKPAPAPADEQAEPELEAATAPPQADAESAKPEDYSRVEALEQEWMGLIEQTKALAARLSSESPVSWNVRYWSPGKGYDCQLTIRADATDEQLKRVLTKAKQALAGLAAAGATPIVRSAAHVSPPASKPKPQEQSGEENQDPAWCPIHSCEMPLHTSKDGKQKWYSHKTDDGDWCRGRNKKG